MQRELKHTREANDRQSAPAEAVRLDLLGVVQVTRGGAPSGGFESRKALALLCYLALQQGPRTRLHLAELFWPDRPEERGRGNLNRVLHNLAQVVPDCLDVTRQTVAIAAGGALSTDLDRFDQLAACEDLAALSAAADLCRGELLAEFVLDECPDFEQWLEGKREQWRQRSIQLYHRLIGHHLAAGSYAEGIVRAQQLLAMDSWQEEGHRAMMRLLSASGQRNAALAQYDICRRILADELGIEPERATTQLYEQLLEGATFSSELPQRPSPAVTHHAPQLPHRNTSFVGREQVIAQIAVLLDNPACRLLTLLGMGGTGKTRVALRAAELLGSRFANGVAFVALEQKSNEAQLLTAIADACGLVFAPGTAPLQQLVNHLRRQQVLLLIDNGEYLGSTAQLLSALLAQTSEVKILATSRERLLLANEHLMDIHGLEVAGSGADRAPSSAVELFRQRLESVRSGQPLRPDELADVVRICELVGGSPLAIELAAGWSRTLSCREICAELATDLNFLTSTMHDVPDRHRSMRAVFEHSWQLLPTEASSACAELSVFCGGFDRAAAQHVAGATPAILAALVDSQFLHRGTGKPYALHELLRQYAQSRLAENPGLREGVLRRHFEHYAALLDKRLPALEQSSRSSETRVALAELVPEIENLRAARDWALMHLQLAAAERFIAGLSLFYTRQGWFAEVVTLMESVLAASAAMDAAANDRGQRLRRARWERQLGVALYSLGRIAESQAHLQCALELLGHAAPRTGFQLTTGLLREALRQSRHRLWPQRSLGSPIDTAREEYIEAARVFERLTEVHYFNNRTAETGYAALMALNLSETYGRSPELARAYANACMAASAIPWTALADTYAQRAEQVAREIGHSAAQAYGLLCAGAAQVGLGRWEPARRALERSIELAAACGEQRVREESLTNLIMLTYYQGELTRQLELCEQLQLLADKRGDTQVQSWARIERAMNALLIGPVELAPALLEAAIELVASNVGSAEAIMAHGLLALAALRNGDRPRALETARRVAELAAHARPTTYFSLQGFASVAEMYLSLWETERRQHAPEPALVEAAAQACRALQRHARVFPVGRPYAALCNGLAASLSGRAARARVIWQAGLAEATALSMPYLQGLLHERIARDLDPRDTAYATHAKQARAIFARLLVHHDLARVEALLGEQAPADHGQAAGDLRASQPEPAGQLVEPERYAPHEPQRHG